jgi:hypothetical protein
MGKERFFAFFHIPSRPFAVKINREGRKGCVNAQGKSDHLSQYHRIIAT